MKNYKKVYAAFILAGGLILHGCNGIFDDLQLIRTSRVWELISPVRPLLMTQ